ncbi:hypothetical protein ACFXPX_36710 [Kitasatospora sp. NPDC059146]|uniref:hypothetical protein n=1 Tax=unclassified Kitasatospora TaxID=2633591 RepID=UPI003686AC31
MLLTTEVTTEEIEKTTAANEQHERLTARLLPLAARTSSHNGPGQPLWHATRFGDDTTQTTGQWLEFPGGRRSHRVELNNLSLPTAVKVLTDLASTDLIPIEARPEAPAPRGEAAQWLSRAVPGLLADDSPLGTFPFPDGAGERFTCRFTTAWLPEAMVRIDLNRPGHQARVDVAAGALGGLEAMILLASYNQTLLPLL